MTDYAPDPWKTVKSVIDKVIAGTYRDFYPNPARTSTPTAGANEGKHYVRRWLLSYALGRRRRAVGGLVLAAARSSRCSSPDPGGGRVANRSA